jgi:putative ABC transport system permease protein
LIGRARLILGLSLRDLWHERRLAICSMIGLAAVLAPLILLFGLKNGVIAGLRADLIENPRSRMIVNASNRTFDQAFFQTLRARPDIAFAVPRTRTLNTEARFERSDRPGTVARAELLASGPGDPLVAGLPHPAPDSIIPSASIAARLDLAPGARVILRGVRGAGADREILAVPVTVTAVAPPAAFARDGVFVDLRLLVLVDGFIDNVLAPTTRPGDIADDPTRAYAGFRAHARWLEDVITIDHALRTQGVEVETLSDQVAGLLGLDRSLNLLFGLIAGLGGLGYLVSLGVGLYANVERKRRDLSLLRLVGLLRRDMILFPLIQSAAIALIGAMAAAAIALSVAMVVNSLDFGQATGGRAICALGAEHVLLATLVTLLGAMAAAIFAGARAARILPSEGLRDA